MSAATPGESSDSGGRFAGWMRDLESRHLANLTFSEVSRALRALSSTYVERRGKIAEGAALAGAGKRAAFALFYGPLHFLLVRHVLDHARNHRVAHAPVVDLGCGTGAAGAAGVAVAGPGTEVSGLDRHPWAIEEALHAYRSFGGRARTRVGDLSRATWTSTSLVIAAFAVNELPGNARAGLLPKLVTHAAGGGPLLIVEPLAGFVAPWWAEWQRALAPVGGESHEWRARLPLPELVEKLDRAAGLNHRELKGRTLSAHLGVVL